MDPGPGGAGAVPELVVEGPASEAATLEGVRRVDRARLGLLVSLIGNERAGPPIRVLALPEDSPAARDAPAWVAGYAQGEHGLVVLFPERSPGYPDAGFESLLVHEVAHVMIDRAADHRSLPRWFHEGLATAAGEWGTGDRLRVTTALLFGGDRSLAALEAAFRSGEPARIGRAYALAGAFVRELLAREGADTAARILAARAQGRSFEDAFHDATGMRLAAAERLFWGTRAAWTRWLELAANSAVLWSGIVLLAGWAFWRRRRRSAEIRRRWEREGVGAEPRDETAPGERPPRTL